MAYGDAGGHQCREEDLAFDVDWDDAWERAVRGATRHELEPRRPEAALEDRRRDDRGGAAEARMVKQPQPQAPLLEFPTAAGPARVGPESEVRGERSPLYSPSPRERSEEEYPYVPRNPAPRTPPLEHHVPPPLSSPTEKKLGERDRAEEVKVAQKRGEGEQSRSPDVVRHGVFDRRGERGLWSLLLVALGLVMCGLLATAAYLLGRAAGDSATIVPDTRLREDVSKLSMQVSELASSLKRLENKVDDLPKPPPPADLGRIEADLKKLSLAINELAPVPARTKKIEDGVANLETETKGFSGELASNKEMIASLKDMMQQSMSRFDSFRAEFKDAVAYLAKLIREKPAATPQGSALEIGAKLFKDCRYAEAADVFRLLAAGNPQDARVYYYAALSNGAATNDWKGETVNYVNRGIELEKLGKPDRAAIDAEFAIEQIVPAYKTWLDAYRQLAK